MSVDKSTVSSDRRLYVFVQKNRRLVNINIDNIVRINQVVSIDFKYVMEV